MSKSEMQLAVSSEQLAVSRRRRTALYCSLLTAYCLLFAVSCRQDMQDQPRYKPLRASTFFKDGLSSRPLVEGTVPRGFLRADKELYTGKIDRNRTGAATAGGQSEGRASGTDAAAPEGQTASPRNAADAQGT